MFESGNGVSRRSVLKATGASVATAGGSGLAAAKPGDVVEVNVGFESESGRNAARDVAADVVREFEFDAVTVRLPKRAAEELAGREDVRYVEENGQMQALEQTLPWGVDRIDADVAHSVGETGDGADVAIIDTGIDDDHPDLQANVGEGEAFVNCGNGGIFGCVFYGNDNDCNEPWSDDNDHGTHCAGIADGIDDSEGVVGVSTEATLHAVKVLDCSGSGSYSDVAAGIEYVAKQGWDVGSMSLGGDKSSTVGDACKYAYDEGVLLVGAAGNDGPCSDCVGYPAARSEVMAVSATTKDDALADFSSTGPEVEIAAPGKDVYSTIPGGYDTLSGTSMACPHVSGVGGQLMANDYTNTEARERMRGTAEDVGLGENEQGSGLVDTTEALGLYSMGS